MQTGGGLPVFVGARMQRGYGRFRNQHGNGLGGILRRLFRSAVPFLIRGGKEVGRQALKTGVNIGDDMLAGKNAKIAAKNRLAEAVGNVTRKVIDHPKVQSIAQTGRGRGIKRKAKPKQGITKKPRKANTSKRKQKYTDIFGL